MPNAGKMKAQTLHWVMPDYIPRQAVTLVAGKRDAGKSTFAAWLTAELSNGRMVNEHGLPIETGEPKRIWFNSQEDPARAVTLPRLRTAGVNPEYVELTGSDDWEGGVLLPENGGKFQDFVAAFAAKGEAFDLIVLDSLATHLANPYHGFRRNRLAMTQLTSVAKTYNVAIVILCHLVKGKVATVEAAIGGQGVIQQQAKSIFLFSPYPEPRSETMALACERSGYGPKPPSILFERTITRKQPSFQWRDVVDVTARDLYAVSKRDSTGTGRGLTDTAASWITQLFAENDWHPMPTRKVELLAEEAGTYFSKGTFNNAKDKAGLLSLTPRQAEDKVEGWLFAPQKDRDGYWLIPSQVPAKYGIDAEGPDDEEEEAS